MGVNRVDFGGNTLIDLTGDTLESADQLLKGIIAHARDGSVITGLMEAGGGGGNTFAFGSIVPASNGPITITHNFGDGYNTASKIKGKTTILIVAAAHANISTGVYSMCNVGKDYDESNGINTSSSYTRWGNGAIHTTTPSISYATSESFTVNNSNASYPFVAGNTYHYAIWDNGNWNG